MSNVIQIKHGASAPGDGVLAPYELGYADDGGLYIGVPSGDSTISKKINGENQFENVLYFDEKDKLVVKTSTDTLEFLDVQPAQTSNPGFIMGLRKVDTGVYKMYGVTKEDFKEWLGI